MVDGMDEHTGTPSPPSEQRILDMLTQRLGLTIEAARRCLAEAKLKVAAGSMVGVAGFWSGPIG